MKYEEVAKKYNGFTSQARKEYTKKTKGGRIEVIQTEYEFKLPKGYVDVDGTLHRKGIMRLATAADEILPLKDPEVKQNPAYFTIILLSRVLTKLGDLPDVNPRVIEGLFASDLAYLQELYNRINGEGNIKLKVKCPHCKKEFETEISSPGE